MATTSRMKNRLSGGRAGLLAASSKGIKNSVAGMRSVLPSSALKRRIEGVKSTVVTSTANARRGLSPSPYLGRSINNGFASVKAIAIRWFGQSAGVLKTHDAPLSRWRENKALNETLSSSESADSIKAAHTSSNCRTSQCCLSIQH